MSKDRPNEISADALKRVVETSGNEIITAYVWHKRMHRCEGFKEAEKKAFFSLSEIKGGRPLEDGTYAAVFRFKIWIFLLFAVLFLLLFLLLRWVYVPANESISIPYDLVPEETSTDKKLTDYSNLYISIPGYSDITLNALNRKMRFYNPKDNECLLKYQLFIQGQLIYETGYLMPGNDECMGFSEDLKVGRYVTEIYAKAYSLDKKNEFNTVYQKVDLIVER